MNDSDVWKFVDADDLWIFDKLILSKKLGYDCGPAGVLPKREGRYIVRPCVNYRMMGVGAKFMHLNTTDDIIPDGHFWCEIFEGPHLSFDYHYGQQVLAVQGFREDENLSRFLFWKRVQQKFNIPPLLRSIAQKYEWLNIEVVGDKVIEVHLRENDDFKGHDGNIVVPIWKGEAIDTTKYKFRWDPCRDRIGFYVIK
jgi:hypothetical protein